MSETRRPRAFPLTGERSAAPRSAEDPAIRASTTRPDALLDGQDGAWPHLSGRLSEGVHMLPVRVYYEDTDFSGGLYHASYVRFLERGRTELLRAAAVSQRDLHRDMEGLAFVVRRMTLEYLKPGHMDDVLQIYTRPQEMRGASMTLAQEIRRGDELLLTADVVVAAVKAGRAVRIPEDLRAALSGAQ